MIDQHCKRCGGCGWVSTANALCTDDKRRMVRCKCPECNCGNAERENDCAHAVQEFIDAHHNPIVAQKNAEISRLAEEVRCARAHRTEELMNHTPEPCVKCQAWQDIIRDEMQCTKQIIDAMGLHAAIEEGQSVQDAILAFIARAKRIEAAAKELLDCGLTCGGEYECDDRWCDEAKAVRAALEANP